MLVSICCFGCGKIVSHLIPAFRRALERGESPAEALLQFRTKFKTKERHEYTAVRLCCSRTILGLDEKAPYLQLIERVQALNP